MINRAKIFICMIAAVCSALFFCACDSPLTRSPSPDIAPHLIETPEAEPVRPIDSREERHMSPVFEPMSKEQFNDRLDELYIAVVDDGVKPVFEDNDPVKPVYDAAIAVLNRYIQNAWHDGGEYSIIHTIHDYLVAYVEYDHELYEKYQTSGTAPEDPAFTLEGVFINKRAVCDGLSKALSFLCAIEGVESMRVTGTFAGVAHAWNRVKLDGKWYNVDVTADAADYFITNENRYRKQLTHGYFLLSDETYRTFNPNPAVLRSHVYSSPTSLAVTDFDYFGDKMVVVGDKKFPATIKDADTLNRLFAAIGEANGAVGKIEVKLEFPEKTNVNNGDLYATEIAEAYKKINSPDFSVSETQKPYFQFPNGVYLFLIFQ